MYSKEILKQMAQETLQREYGITKYVNTSSLDWQYFLPCLKVDADVAVELIVEDTVNDLRKAT